MQLDRVVLQCRLAPYKHGSRFSDLFRKYEVGSIHKQHLNDEMPVHYCTWAMVDPGPGAAMGHDPLAGSTDPYTSRMHEAAPIKLPAGMLLNLTLHTYYGAI
jgi:hypothetical protein